MKNASIVCLVFVLSGCATLDADFINALAKDDASFCASVDIRGGAGGIIGGATGGYGQSTLAFCRSRKNNASVALNPDGSMSIQHGAE